MISSSGNSPVVRRYEELLQVWQEANEPLEDERPEMLEWYEERRTEAQNSLVEFRRQHVHELPREAPRFGVSHVLATLRRVGGLGNRFGLDHGVVGKMQAH